MARDGQIGTTETPDILAKVTVVFEFTLPLFDCPIFIGTPVAFAKPSFELQSVMQPEPQLMVIELRSPSLISIPDLVTLIWASRPLRFSAVSAVAVRC